MYGVYEIKMSTKPAEVPKNSSCSTSIEGSGEAKNTTYSPSSATFHLFKKAASGFPFVADIFSGLTQELFWDDNSLGVSDGFNVQNVDVGLAACVVSELFIPYLHWALKVLLPIENFADEFSFLDLPKCKESEKEVESNWGQRENDDNQTVSALSEISDSSLIERTEENAGGLLLQGPDLNTNESNQRLDYVITQMDISRMARTASRGLDVKSVNHLPTIIYHEHDPLICPGNNDFKDDDLLAGAAISLEDNLIGNGYDSELKDISDSPQVWSWMVVPPDPKEDDVTRFSGAIPESISICSSHHSNNHNMEKSCLDSFEYCVVCQEPFQEGECLRVLPCQHLFHCGCIDKWLSKDACMNERGCPMCKQGQDMTSREDVSHGSSANESDDPPCQDGSVPSWAFARLGDILSSVSNENHFSK